MTKNRAQKKAARGLKESTGRSYADAKRNNAAEPYPYQWEFLNSVEKMAPVVAKQEKRFISAKAVVALCEADPEAELQETREAVGQYYRDYLQAEAEIELNLTKWYASRDFKPMTITVSGTSAASQEDVDQLNALCDSGLKERHAQLKVDVDALDEIVKSTLAHMGY